MGASLLWTLVSVLLSVILCQHTEVSNKVSVSLDPNWSEVFVGERLTLRCEVEGSGDTWTYLWRRNNVDLTERTGEYTFSSLRYSDRGDYSCKGERGSSLKTLWSSTTTVNVQNKPEVRVSGSKELQTGGSVTLSCSVSPSSSGWKYSWIRNKQLLSDFSSELRVSEGGEYQCRAFRGDPLYFTDFSPSFMVTETVSNKVSVTLDPNWSVVFVGERLTLRCEVEGSGDTWFYHWRRNNMALTETTSEYTITNVTESYRGNYRCRGKRGPSLTTQWSSTITVNVERVPRPLLSAPGSWLTPGASVSLSCAVTAPSAGWSYHWYRAVPQSEGYRYELLLEASAGTTQDSFSVQGLTNTAAFVCGAARGTPRFYSEHSEPSFVWSADAESSVSLSVSPDRAQHFTDDIITLSCGFSSADSDWRVRRFYYNKLSIQKCHKTTNKTKCKFSLSYEQSAVFWCESGSGEMSNAVNISVHSDIILVSPVRPVTEGQPVSLGCKLKTAVQFFSFYKNGKLVQNGTKAEFNISAVSRSDQGLYKCEAQGQKEQWWGSVPKTWTSAESWMSVRLVPKAKEEFVSFLVMWLIAPVCAVVLLVLLLLLWRYKIKDLWSLRTVRTNQSSADDHLTRNDSSPSNGRRNRPQEESDYLEPYSLADTAQNRATDPAHVTEENQEQLYSALLKDEVTVYETLSQVNEYENAP